MQFSSASFLSQEDASHASLESSCTPIDQEIHQKDHDMMKSPQNRKKRGRFFAIFGKSNANAEVEREIEPSHFNMSQDDTNEGSLSQFSQDFSDRLCGLSMKASQDPFIYSDNSKSSSRANSMSNLNPYSMSNPNSNRDNTFVPFSSMKLPQPPPLSQSRYNPNSNPNSNNSNSNYEIPIPVVSSSSSARTSYQASNPNTKPMMTEKQITIAPALTNPFIERTTSSLSLHRDKRIRTNRNSMTTNLWISAFKERPRYMTDFEHVFDLGEY
jgi:hypothetical protein